MKNIAVLITCHNRKLNTISCIDAIYKCKVPEGFLLDVILVDDGSTDGTGDSVQDLYPQVFIMTENGNLFWNGGMRVAFDYAMKKKYEYYLWLNDDTLIYPNAVSNAIATVHSLSSKECVVAVGSTHAIQGGNVTYGGLVRVGKRLSYKSQHVEPTEVPIECEQMNGNFVLIPSTIAKVVGNLDKNFVHNLGDIDYGMRVRAAGFKLMVMPGFAGTCDRNCISGLYLDRSLTFRARMRSVLSVKAFPLIPWLIFTWRHAGPLWFLYWIKPYFDVMFATVRSK